jgi:hypothetical protein
VEEVNQLEKALAFALSYLVLAVEACGVSIIVLNGTTFCSWQR